ncbi:LADA_0C06788g1_1 [Lachancea dasiensis]|uniref:LADA_0C06788g1_1 n=1 Tax=Lachancea dasiensis TaxID=1072105 RepID=A0A1G4IZL9_9SACH|nr:LADA_0C06788g1_1 [Lachancea dasiensis]
MGIKVANTKVSSKSSKAVYSALGLLAILVFVGYTSCDAVRLYGSLTHSNEEPEVGTPGTAGLDPAVPQAVFEPAAVVQDDTKQVEQIFSEIKLEIDASSSTTARRASATRVATTEVVRSEVVHGPHNYKPQHVGFDPAVNFQEILNTSPVVIFVDSHHDSQLLRTLLQRHYEISPPPVVVDLEKHSRGAQLESFIEKTKVQRPANQKKGAQVSHAAPYLFINGHSVINTDFQTDIQDMHARHKLLDKLKSVAEGNVMFARNNAPSNS